MKNMVKTILYLSIFLCASTPILAGIYKSRTLSNGKSEWVLVIKISLEKKSIFNDINFQKFIDGTLDIGNLPVSDEYETKPIKDIKKSIALDLSQLDLEQLPKGLENLSNVIMLDVSHNKLTHLPDQIGKMEQLIEINASYNQLTDVSTTIGNLKNLIKLNLSGNELQVLPKEINSLPNLQELNIAYNELSELPKVNKSVKLITSSQYNSKK